MFRDANNQTNNSSHNGGTDKMKKISGNNNNILNNPIILTGMSHEVRTYMNSIVAFSYLQGSDGCSEKDRKEYNEHILTSCEQLVTLFDNFLDSALIDSEKRGTTPSRFRLDTMFEELAIELNNSIGKFGKKEVISFVLDGQPDTEELYIDEERIIRVIKNLFYNALEHTNSGYIKIGYKKRDGKIIFYIIDSGNGYDINKELLTTGMITTDSVKSNNTFTTIGLILAQKLIKSLGGELWIEPNGINGSRVCFSTDVKSLPESENIKTQMIKSRIAI
ncbi:MAG: HAMP domain-containing histidine kinase [Bacteroidales bacterium]|nr:HAMP domain-containing histidine kinase [Bacteroidales bacterium]